MLFPIFHHTFLNNTSVICVYEADEWSETVMQFIVLKKGDNTMFENYDAYSAPLFENLIVNVALFPVYRLKIIKIPVRYCKLVQLFFVSLELYQVIFW